MISVQFNEFLQSDNKYIISTQNKKQKYYYTSTPEGFHLPPSHEKSQG